MNANDVVPVVGDAVVMVTLFVLGLVAALVASVVMNGWRQTWRFVEPWGRPEGGMDAHQRDTHAPPQRVDSLALS